MARQAFLEPPARMNPETQRAQRRVRNVCPMARQPVVSRRVFTSSGFAAMRASPASRGWSRHTSTASTSSSHPRPLRRESARCDRRLHRGLTSNPQQPAVNIWPCASPHRQRPYDRRVIGPAVPLPPSRRMPVDYAAVLASQLEMSARETANETRRPDGNPRRIARLTQA